MLSQVAGHRWLATPTHYGERHEALQRMRTTYLKEGSYMSSIVAGQSLIMAVFSAVCCQWASFSWGVDILRIINQGKLEARHI